MKLKKCLVQKSSECLKCDCNVQSNTSLYRMKSCFKLPLEPLTPTAKQTS